MDLPHHSSKLLGRRFIALALAIIILATITALYTSPQIAEAPHIATSEIFHYNNITLDLKIRAPPDSSSPTWYTGPDPITTDKDQLDTRGQMIKKGAIFLCMMRAALRSTRENIASTPWNDASSLEAYGWEPDLTTPAEEITTSGLNLTFQDTGISDCASDWVEIAIHHRQKSTIDGTTYPATKGGYESSVCLSQGILVATWNYSPSSMVQSGLSKGPVPPLQRWSDVTFLGWKEALEKYPSMNGNLNNIEHVFRWSLNGEETNQKIQDITGKTLYDYGGWPGSSYSVDSDQGKPLLTIDNAIGVTWLLAQHKSTMGIKAVDRVALFDCATTVRQLCMYLHISSVAEGQQI